MTVTKAQLLACLAQNLSDSPYADERWYRIARLLRHHGNEADVEGWARDRIAECGEWADSSRREAAEHEAMAGQLVAALARHARQSRPT